MAVRPRFLPDGRFCHGLLGALFVTILAAWAQEPRHEVVVVTGAADPIPLDEADRSVVLLPVQDRALLAGSLADLLRLDPSLDLRGRAPDGVQTDLSIRGGTFGQTLVLLNGMRLNDVQTGHHSLDLPLPLEAISRVEVLRGAGSTLYGSDAVGGAVNIVTLLLEATEARLRVAAGNFGVNQERLLLAGAFRRGAGQLTASRDFSSGFRPGRDYRNLTLAATGFLRSALGATSLVAGYSDRPFGADQFYGNFNSWENTKTWFASVQQELGERTHAAFAFRRHSDLFVLYRYQPERYTNHHADEMFQASLRRREPLAANTTLHYGVEGLTDSILSTNLGRHERGRAAVYGTLDFRALKRFSLSIGAREEVWRQFSGELSPTIAGGAWLSEHWKLRASASRAFRIPTYTELYYRDPANIGSPELRPERAWSYETGADWFGPGSLHASLTVFHRRETNSIDYVRRTTAEPWRAVNLGELRFTGAEAAFSLAPARAQQLDVRYTALAGSQAALSGLLSKYVFNYPSHAATVAWQAALPRGLIARTRLGVENRRGRAPYAVWDAYAAWTERRVRPFVQLTNLSDARYEEIAGVIMPGRAVVGGLEIALKR